MTDRRRRIRAVVVVEDDQDIRALMHYTLADRHVAVAWAPGVVEAQQMDWRRFDAAAVDFRMPGQDGLTLVEWLRENHPHVRCVVFTASPELALTAAKLRGVAVPILSKPFTADELWGAIRDA